MKGVIIIIAIGIALSQLAPNTAINSCGAKLVDSKQPTESNDCKPGGEHNLCCFVEIPEKSMKYCAFMPNTKLEDDVVSEFKTIIGKTANVVCNTSMTLNANVFIMVLCLFSIFFL